MFDKPIDLTCEACGKRHDEVRKLIIGSGTDIQGSHYQVRICSECVATFMTIMAHEDREWFDEQVERSRVFKPGTGEPETSH